MRFKQDFTKDLGTIVDALGNEPFCLLRFGDGESAILRGRERPFITERDGETWNSEKIPSMVVDEMRKALAADMSDLYIATICPACSRQSSKPLRDEVTCPLERQTYAEIFGNANWGVVGPHARFIRDQCFLVSSAPEADLQIPTNLPEMPVEAHAAIVDVLMDVDQPIALAAGPSACVIGHMYWLRTEDGGRQTCLDVGALFDEMYWRHTRHYMPSGSPRGRRVCTWDGEGVGLDTD